MHRPGIRGSVLTGSTPYVGAQFEVRIGTGQPPCAARARCWDFGCRGFTKV